jgi:hypothetical protein
MNAYQATPVTFGEMLGLSVSGVSNSNEVSSADIGPVPGTTYSAQSLPPLYLQATTTNGFAIASLVLGIIPVVPIVGSILAIIFGNVGKTQIDTSGGRERGRGLAIAGITLGWVSTVGYAILLIALH